jgi:drug/metabolite transporter (DMT)-like permease
LLNSKRTIQIKNWGLTRADGVLLLTAIFWGVNFSVVKFALAALPPMAFNGLRFTLAALTMFILTWAAGYRFNFQRRHIFYLIGLGLLGNTAYQLFFVLGIDKTTADNASLILATAPAWVALIGTVVGMERVKAGGWLGVLLSLIGVILIIVGIDRQAEFQFGGATLGGDILVLLATLCWAGYTLLIRPLMRLYASAVVTSFSTLMGAVPLVVVTLPTIVQLDWAEVPLSAWSALLFSSIFAITLAYFFWNYGVARLGSARTSLYSYLTPPVALLTAWFWLGETLTLQQVWGTLLVLVGMVLARRFTQPLGKSE